jgi:hypothetical protein
MPTLETLLSLNDPLPSPPLPRLSRVVRVKSQLAQDVRFARLVAHTRSLLETCSPRTVSPAGSSSVPHATMILDALQ